MKRSSCKPAKKRQNVSDIHPPPHCDSWPENDSQAAAYSPDDILSLPFSLTRHTPTVIL